MRFFGPGQMIILRGHKNNMEIPAHRKKIAHTVTQAIGIEPSVRTYLDEKEQHSIDLLSLTDPDTRAIKIYCSIGVSESNNLVRQQDGNFKNVPVELLMTGYEPFDSIPNILVTCGFYITKNQWVCQPGAVFRKIIEIYHGDKEMKHVMFVPPFLWGDRLPAVEQEDKTVYFLLAVPISDQELEYLEQHGGQKLEALFEQHNIDLFDLDRKSIL